MKKRIWVLWIGLVAVAGGPATFASGDAEPSPDETADNVFLGELDLAERMEIWRNQFRRMTPGNAPLVQDVGTWPAAWEEFSHAWAVAPAERDLATWLVPVTAERSGALTVLRDVNGTALWSGATDFAKDESANETLTGWLASEDDWPLYEAARAALAHRLPSPRLRDGGGYPNEPDPPGLRFVSASADFTNTPPEFRVGLTWTNTGMVDVFAYGPLHVAKTNEVTYTNDENAVVTVTNVSWHCVEPSLSGFNNAWTWAGTLGVTNSETNVFVDTSFTEERAKVRFYAAAPAVDTDGDGLNDGFEIFVSGSDPDSYDGDHDGIGDAQEFAAGANPSVSNLWWAATTTNKLHKWKSLGTHIPTTPQHITNYPVTGDRPTSNSVVHDVRITGFVDDILCVDSNVVGGWDAGPTNFVNLSVLVQTTNAQSGSLILGVWDLPAPGYVGENEVKLGNSSSDQFRVVWDWRAPVELTIDVESSVASVSSNPPPFEGFREWPFCLTNSQPPDKHFVVFFKDAMHFDANTNFVTNDFDIVLSAVVTPESFPVGDCSPHWYKISGPESGVLLNTNTFSACFRNPKKGGVYRFAFDLGWPGAPVSEATVFLPLAGAEVNAVITNDMRLADEFAAKVRSKYRWYDRNRPDNGARWFFDFGAGDYRGRVDGILSQTDWYYNFVTPSGLAGVATWKGCPVKTAKMSNYLVAYAARKIGVFRVAAWWAQRQGTPNDSSAQKSWDAGWEVGGGADYNTVVGHMVRDIWDEADEKNRLFWPNTEPASNHVNEQTWTNYKLPDFLFTSPGFVYMSDP